MGAGGCSRSHLPLKAARSLETAPSLKKRVVWAVSLKQSRRAGGTWCWVVNQDDPVEGEKRSICPGLSARQDHGAGRAAEEGGRQQSFVISCCCFLFVCLATPEPNRISVSALLSLCGFLCPSAVHCLWLETPNVLWAYKKTCFSHKRIIPQKMHSIQLMPIQRCLLAGFSGSALTAAAPFTQAPVPIF